MNRPLYVTLRLRSPLVHGDLSGADIGNASAIRRIPVVGLDGCPEVPALSGNALRGTLRRLVMRALWDRCDLSALDGTAHDRLYAALANGGHLDGSEQRIRPDYMRAVRDALPPLSVFGAALYSWMLAGRMRVGFGYPACQETLAARMVEATEIPIPLPEPLPFAEELVHETSVCRQIDRERHDPTLSGVTPMPVTYETIAPGAVLQHRLYFDPEATPLERACVVWGLQQVAHLGGKSGQGFGEVEVLLPEGETGDAYTQWLSDHLPDAQEALLDLGRSFKAPKTRKKKAP